MPDEVEVKVLIDDLSALQEKLRKAGFQLQTPPTHEVNTLYDYDDRRLQKAGQLLRIRHYGSEGKVTHKSKGREGTHKTREETETNVGDGKQLEQIFKAVGLKPGFVYEKYRAEWTDGRGNVVLDETPIGNLAEIEGKPAWIDSTAEALGIGKAQYITKNYMDLFREWKEQTGSEAANMTFDECRQGCHPLPQVGTS